MQDVTICETMSGRMRMPAWSAESPRATWPNRGSLANHHGKDTLLSKELSIKRPGSGQNDVRTQTDTCGFLNRAAGRVSCTTEESRSGRAAVVRTGDSTIIRDAIQVCNIITCKQEGGLTMAAWPPGLNNNEDANERYTDNARHQHGHRRP